MGYIKQNIDENTDMTAEVFNHMEDGIEAAHDGLACLSANIVFITTGGTANAQTVDIVGTFDLSKDGNQLHINPSLTNTGAMTINPDSQGAKTIKKFDVDTNAYVDIEPGDIKKNNPVTLRWDLMNGFFVLAPKGGANIKNVQRGTVIFASANTIQNITINPVNLNAAVVIIKAYPYSSAVNNSVTVMGKLTSSTNIEISRNIASIALTVSWEVIEFNNVKSLQKGDYSLIVDVYAHPYSKMKSISPINPAKSMIFYSFKTNRGATTTDLYVTVCDIVDATNIKFTIFDAATTYTRDIHWQVIEFK